MTYRGKHRKASAATKTIARVAVAGFAVGAPLAIVATPAQAADWDSVAQCESGGNWSTSTGNGFSGGLQFTPSTWSAYGGQGSASSASRDQQIQVAERVLAAQGPGAWPNCFKGGSTAKSSNTGGTQQKTQSAPKQKVQQQSAPVKQQQAPAKPAATAKSNPNGDYEVKEGDTLSKIADAQKVDGGFQKLVDKNQGYISDADYIVVGQKIATK